MVKIRLRKKISYIVAILFILILSFVSAASLSRNISQYDSYGHDDIDTFIRNSKGNYWEATVSNIQTAINDLGDEGGQVFLPKGTYNLSERILLDGKSNIQLIGSGIGNTVIRGEDGMIAEREIIRGVSCNNITLSDFTIDGNADGVEDGYTSIYFSSFKDLIIKNIYITRPGRSGLGLNSGVRALVSNIFISEITLYHGIGLNTVDDSIFRDCIIWNNHDQYGVDMTKCHNCTLDNIHISDCNYGMKVTGTSDRGSDLCNINNIQLFHIGNSGLKIEYTTRSNFNNIQVDQAGTNGINIFPSCYELNLNNLYVTEAGNVGLSVQGNDININNAHILGSISYGLYISSARNITFSNGIFRNTGNLNYVCYTEKVTFNNCQFLDGDSYGLYLKDSNDILITNCEIQGNQADGLEFSSDGGPCDNFVVSNCIITDNVGNGIHVTSNSHDYFSIIDNIVRSNSGTDIVNTASGSHYHVDKNIGWITDNNGVCTIEDGLSSITVSHGLDVTPTVVSVTPLNDLSGCGGSTWYVSNITSSQFTLNVDASLSSDCDFSWWAFS